MADPGAKLSNECIDELFALKAQGLSGRAIAKQLGLSPATVSDYLSGKRQRSDTPAAAATADALADYTVFVARKLEHVPPTGMASANVTNPALFPHAQALTTWALRLGRAGIFAATGLAKSSMLAEYAHAVSEHAGGRFLILTPLAVAHQIKAECRRVGYDATIIRSASDIRPGINVCNYERLHLLDASAFAGIGLDESSCVKDFNSKTLADLKAFTADISWILSATATPSPNDFTELGTQAELLRICTRTEMLSEYFVHDGGDTQTWRLKGHARREFWRFVASWGALVRSPADLGFDASGYDLPRLHVHMHTIEATAEHLREQGTLFAQPAAGLMEQRAARRASMSERVRRCVEQVMSEPDEPWIVWCELNDEQDALAAAFGDECASVYGSLDIDDKEARLSAFLSGEKRILLSKPSICGWGVNAQRAARMAFVGISNSWEQYHQAVRRIWRFGQRRECHVHLFASEFEGNVLRNLQRKEADAQRMAEELSRETAESVRASVLGQIRRTNVYASPTISLPSWMKGTGT